MSHILKPTKPPLYIQPPFDVDTWEINKGVMIEKAHTDTETIYNLETFFTAGMGTIMTYKQSSFYTTHSRDPSTGQVINDGSCYQFQGGERVILYGLVFISQVLPGQFFRHSSDPLELGWQVLVESYLLNDLEYYDLLYE